MATSSPPTADSDNEETPPGDSAASETTESETSPGEESASDESRRVWLDRALRVAPWLVALAVSITFAISFGFNYGVDNQVAYLLGGLRLAHPGLLNHDWYAAHTTQYHPAFIYFSGLLLMIDSSGWSIAIAQTIVITIGTLLTYWTVEILAGRRLALPVFLLLMGFAFLTRMHSVGISYIFDHILQPSTLGSLGWVATLPFFLKKRWLASGIFLGLGGLFHANYLVLGFPIFGLAHLILGKKELIKRLLLQLGPSLVAFAILSPIILASIGSPYAHEAHQIYFHMRSAHHYVPASYERNFSPFFGWQVLGLGAGWYLMRSLRGAAGRLGALLLAMLFVVWTCTVLTTAVYIPLVAQGFVWRAAPFSDLWFQLFICLAAVHVFTDPIGVRRRFPTPALIAVCAGLGFLMMYYGDRRDKPMIALLADTTLAVAIVLVVAGVRFLWTGRWHALVRRVWRHAGLALAIVATAAVVVLEAQDSLATVRQRSTLLHGFPPVYVQLFHWMRTQTPKDARFLSPPGIETIRYDGERAIVVDWKSTPILPHELVEWRNRLADVTGRPNFRSWRDLAGYNFLDERRLEYLKRKYHLDYVIVGRGRARGLQGKVVFRNAAFTVLKL